MVDIILPIVDADRCTGCGVCVEACPMHAVELVGDSFAQVVIVRPEDCEYCGDCEEICPEGAIGLPYEVVLAETVER